MKMSNFQRKYSPGYSDLYWENTIDKAKKVYCSFCSTPFGSLSKDDGIGNARKQWPDWLNEKKQ